MKAVVTPTSVTAAYNANFTFFIKKSFESLMIIGFVPGDPTFPDFAREII